MVLYYDARTGKTKDWNDVGQTARSTIRGLYISKLCLPG